MLSFEVRINEKLIVNGTATRQEPLAGTDTGWFLYDYTVMERDGREDPVEEQYFTGEVGHKYEDGALRLVGRVIDAVRLVKLDGDGKYGMVRPK